MLCVNKIHILGSSFLGYIWGHVRKVCNIGEDVQCGRNSKSKRSGNHKDTNWIPDLIEDIVHILPSVISVKDFEHRGYVLREC